MAPFSFFSGRPVIPGSSMFLTTSRELHQLLPRHPPKGPDLTYLVPCRRPFGVLLLFLWAYVQDGVPYPPQDLFSKFDLPPSPMLELIDGFPPPTRDLDCSPPRFLLVLFFFFKVSFRLPCPSYFFTDDFLLFHAGFAFFFFPFSFPSPSAGVSRIFF